MCFNEQCSLKKITRKQQRAETVKEAKTLADGAAG